MNIFEGMKILWIFLGGHHKIGLYLGVISMHFRVFSQGQGTEWGMFFTSYKIWYWTKYVRLNFSKISRLKILTFINGKKSVNRKNLKREKRIQCFKKGNQLYSLRALMGIYESCCELVFLSCKTTTTFGLVRVADMIWN